MAFDGLWDGMAAPAQGRLCCSFGFVIVLRGLIWVIDLHDSGAFAAVWRC